DAVQRHLLARARRHARRGAEFDAGGVVPLGVDAGGAAVLTDAVPGDHEAAGGVHRHAGHALVAGGGGVDGDLTAKRRPVGGVTPGVHAVSVGGVLAVALPSHDEVTRRVHRHRGTLLVEADVRADVDLVAAPVAGRVIPLGVQAVARG